MTIDRNLTFEKHVRNLCDKAGKKLSVLSSIIRFIPFNRKRILLKSFIESQFSYCPLIWMFCSRKINNRINRIHERALRLAYNDYSITFENLLEKEGSLSIHHRNVHRLANEMFKVYKGTGPKIYMDNFITKENMSLRFNSVFYRPNINSVLKGENSLRNFGPIVWNELLPNFIKMWIL